MRTLCHFVFTWECHLTHCSCYLLLSFSLKDSHKLMHRIDGDQSLNLEQTSNVCFGWFLVVLFKLKVIARDQNIFFDENDKFMTACGILAVVKWKLLFYDDDYKAMDIGQCESCVWRISSKLTLMCLAGLAHDWRSFNLFVATTLPWRTPTNHQNATNKKKIDFSEPMRCIINKLCWYRRWVNFPICYCRSYTSAGGEYGNP